MTTILSFACALALAQPTPDGGASELTDEMVGRTTEFYEWVFDVPLTAEQRGKLKDDLEDAWKKGDPKVMKDVADTLKNQEDLAKMAREERDMLRAQLQNSLLTDMRRHPDGLSKWALDLYDSVHKPLVAGKVPLTRQVADAYAELVVFLIDEAAAGEPYAADKGFKDAVAKSLAGDWKKLTPADQEQMHQVPTTWAAVRASWPTVAEEEKAKFRKTWSDALHTDAPKADEPNRSAQWAQNLLKGSRVVQPKVVSELGSAGWRYEYKYW